MVVIHPIVSRVRAVRGVGRRVVRMCVPVTVRVLGRERGGGCSPMCDAVRRRCMPAADEDRQRRESGERASDERAVVPN